MIPELRTRFNRSFTSERYASLLAWLERPLRGQSRVSGVRNSHFCAPGVTGGDGGRGSGPCPCADGQGGLPGGGAQAIPPPTGWPERCGPSPLSDRRLCLGARFGRRPGAAPGRDSGVSRRFTATRRCSVPGYPGSFELDPAGDVPVGTGRGELLEPAQPDDTGDASIPRTLCSQKWIRSIRRPVRTSKSRPSGWESRSSTSPPLSRSETSCTIEAGGQAQSPSTASTTARLPTN